MDNSREAVEVYEAIGDHDRTVKDAIHLLDPDGPLPAIGDLLLLKVDAGTGILVGASTAAFRVVDREHFYLSPPDGAEETAKYCKSWIHVRRLTLDEYLAAPGAKP